MLTMHMRMCVGSSSLASQSWRWTATKWFNDDVVILYLVPHSKVDICRLAGMQGANRHSSTVDRAQSKHDLYRWVLRNKTARGVPTNCGSPQASTLLPLANAVAFKASSPKKQ